MKFSIIIFLLLLSGCTTIHFKNGPDTPVTNKTEQWHHNAVLALVEVSDPVDLTEECVDKEWSTVTTELTFFNGLASGVVNLIAPIWFPKTVTVTCQ